jgi:hypothetical protein
MILISHRGNITGTNKRLENTPNYIDSALLRNIDVEVDIWFINGQFKLGHDAAEYSVDENWLLDRRWRLWCHAKNIEAISHLFEMDMHCFWHETDTVALTSQYWLWTFPGKQLTDNSIAVMPEMLNTSDNILAGNEWLNKFSYAGVCTDRLDLYDLSNIYNHEKV